MLHWASFFSFIFSAFSCGTTFNSEQHVQASTKSVGGAASCLASGRVRLGGGGGHRPAGPEAWALNSRLRGSVDVGKHQAPSVARGRTQSCPVSCEL